MSLVKIGTLLLVSAVVACVLFVVVVLATPTPEPDAPFDGWQVLGTLLLIYWLGAAVAGAIVLLVNLLNSDRHELSFFGLRLPFRQAVESRPVDSDRSDNGMRNRGGHETVEKPSPMAGSVRASVFCSKCGAQNSRGQRFCDTCEGPLPA